MEVQKFTKFETLLKEGDPGGALYIVLEGVVRVRKMISGREDVLATLGAGEMFGEMSCSMIPNARRMLWPTTMACCAT